MRPTTRPGSSVPSASFTVRSSVPATTWCAVRIRPLLSNTTPEPTPCAGSSCTTASPMRRTTSCTEPLVVPLPPDGSEPGSVVLVGRRAAVGSLSSRSARTVPPTRAPTRRTATTTSQPRRRGLGEGAVGSRSTGIAVATRRDLAGDHLGRVGCGQRIGDRGAGGQVPPAATRRLLALRGRGVGQGERHRCEPTDGGIKGLSRGPTASQRPGRPGDRHRHRDGDRRGASTRGREGSTHGWMPSGATTAPASAAGEVGSQTTKVAPAPSVELTVSRPPWASTAWRAMVRPRPRWVCTRPSPASSRSRS